MAAASIPLCLCQVLLLQSIDVLGRFTLHHATAAAPIRGLAAANEIKGV
jgi:hypothetical protein